MQEVARIKEQRKRKKRDKKKNSELGIAKKLDYAQIKILYVTYLYGKKKSFLTKKLRSV